MRLSCMCVINSVEAAFCCLAADIQSMDVSECCCNASCGDELFPLQFSRMCRSRLNIVMC
jgi:hypothetical protein